MNSVGICEILMMFGGFIVVCVTGRNRISGSYSFYNISFRIILRKHNMRLVLI